MAAASAAAGIPEKPEIREGLLSVYEDAEQYCERYPRGIYPGEMQGIKIDVYCRRRDTILAELREIVARDRAEKDKT